eukprot:4751607-Ditylum_brightwellii.AAC.1
MNETTQQTLTINDLGRDPIRDPGEMATMPKKNGNTTPISKPSTFGEVAHFDIVYGPGTAIGGTDMHCGWLTEHL